MGYMRDITRRIPNRYDLQQQNAGRFDFLQTLGHITFYWGLQYLVRGAHD